MKLMFGPSLNYCVKDTLEQFCFIYIQSEIRSTDSEYSTFFALNTCVFMLAYLYMQDKTCNMIISHET